MNERKTAGFSFRLEADLFLRFKRWCDKAGYSLSDAMREAVSDLIKKKTTR